MRENQWKQEKNLTMLLDFYELTMANGYFKMGKGNQTAVFDMFFRKIPDQAGFAICAGLEQLIDYFENLHFTKEDIEYLRGRGMFDEAFLDYLADFHFECDVWAVPEGTPIFPNEPVLIVKGPIIQAQLVETMVLLTINHQSLIATKSNRIVRAAQGRSIMEFGSRRAQSYDAAILGARAAYIAGCDATACAIADRDYHIPAVGTMAHSWVQMFGDEYESFRKYAELYPDNCVLLVDTYNVLKSGIPNAIRAFDEVLAPLGKRPKGVRIDSGDIAYLSKKARKMLDEAGFPDCAVCASNSLDEYIIRDMLQQGAKVDSFGVGERLITSKSEPVFGGVYKLAAIEDENGNIIPKIKVSENVEKITTPCFKKLWRLYDIDTNKAIADVITLHNEVIDSSKPYEIFDPNFTWKRKTVENFIAVPLKKQYFKEGKLIYDMPDIHAVKDYCKACLDTLWDEVKRFENPHTYYVDLSQKLWDIKNELLKGKKK